MPISECYYLLLLGCNFFYVLSFEISQVVRWKIIHLPRQETDTGSIPGLGIFLGEGNDNPLQYSCLNNLMDKGNWQVTAHRVAKSQSKLSY